MIHFENKIHLFWQMLVLGQRPKLSLIFFGIVTQDRHFFIFSLTLLSDKQNCSFGTWRNNYLPSRRYNVELVFGFGESDSGHWTAESNDKCARSPFVCAARTLLLWVLQPSRGCRVCRACFQCCNCKKNRNNNNNIKNKKNRHIWKDRR